MRALLLVLSTLAAAAPDVAGEPAFVMVVNAQNAAASATRMQVERLFLKKDTTWPNGHAALPVDLSDSSPARAAFSREVLGRGLPAVRAYWQQQIFSGREVPPPERPGDAEVLAFVAGNTDAVGYVSPAAAKTLPAGVKLLPLHE